MRSIDAADGTAEQNCPGGPPDVESAERKADEGDLSAPALEPELKNGRQGDTRGDDAARKV